MDKTKDYEVRYSLDTYGYETEFETRSEGKNLIIGGYAAVFNKRSQDLGGFIEEIAEGTFSKTINENDVRALWNHNADHILGRNRARNGYEPSLRLGQDSTGLEYEVQLIDSDFNRSLYEQIARGDVSQSSFGFATIDQAWGKTEEGRHLRTLKEVQLFDVSPVTYPAYTNATIGVRALEHLAAVRNMDLADVQQDVGAALDVDNTMPVKTTYVVSRYLEPAELIRIRGRINKG